MMLLINLFVVLGVGVVLGREWNKHILQSKNEEHKKEMDEIFKEVKRLRAQNANLIGREDAPGK